MSAVTNRFGSRFQSIGKIKRRINKNCPERAVNNIADVDVS